ncbi:MAG: hypothetical protein VKK04_16270 [Synechococcales bacterium]|nr:hypothetical protein [Synechococcales bacterium]
MATTIRDVIYSIATRARYGLAIARNPLYYMRHRGEQLGHDLLDRPLDAREARSPETPAPTSVATLTRVQAPPGTLVKPASRIVDDGDKIQGRRGRYRRTAMLDPGKQWYEGQHISSHQAVWIREYTLPEQSLNQREMTERREAFEQLNHLRFQATGGRDFRLVTPLEAIAPPQTNRFYWITKAIPHSLTLREYLTHFGPMAPPQVRQVLLQVLQTLMFLHSQRWVGRWQRGIAHGNLSLDSLLIADQASLSQGDETPLQPKFWIYVTDLALWEDLFRTSERAIVPPSVTQDLQDLGNVAVQLLLGRDDGSIAKEQNTNQQRWATISDQPLTYFIQRLIGLSGEPFSSAEAAYHALLNLPGEEVQDSSDTNFEPDKDARPFPWQLLLKTAVLTFVLGLLGTAIWLSWLRIVGVGAPAALPSTDCCIGEVDPPADQSITYVAESSGSWGRVLAQTGLVAQNQTFLEVLRSRDARLSHYAIQERFVGSPEEAIAQIQSGATDFVLTHQQESLPEGLVQEVIAYDAVVFITAYSDATLSYDVERSPSLPQLLNGRITFAQLRQLYTGEIEHWGAPRALRDWSVKLYMPAEQGAIAIFEEKVLKGDIRRIDRFRRLQGVEIAQASPTFRAFGQIFADFEQNQVMGIGFALLSQVYKQCSVYPLAAGELGQEIQVMAQLGGRPLRPHTDLCNDKGSYFPDIKALQSYPLSYPLVVVYPKEGGRSRSGQWFSRVLKTGEGQRLLREAGLVPLQPLTP